MPVRWAEAKKPKHDHRGSVWLISNGRLIWCYQCGAWTYNISSAKKKAMGGPAWYRPTGIGGQNPAAAKVKK